MSTVQSIERAFSILRTLAVAPSGVSYIAGQVGLPKSTVARILATLESIGVVERMEDSSDYRIGVGIGELAGSLDASATLAVAVTQSGPDRVRPGAQLLDSGAPFEPFGRPGHVVQDSEDVFRGRGDVECVLEFDRHGASSEEGPR